MNRFPDVGKFALPLFLLFVITNISYGQARSDSLYRLRAGTRIKLALTAELHSAVSSVDDTFTATVAEAVKDHDLVVLPKGTVFTGRVTRVERAKPGARNGRLEFVIEKMLTGKDIRRSVDAETITQFRPTAGDPFATVGLVGGTAVGAIIGYALRNDAGGALIGGALGAGVGTGALLIKRGKDVRIKQDQEFEIELKSDLVMPVLDF